MVNNPNYPTRAFIFSAIIALIIFLAGMLLGWSLDKFRESDILENIQINELNTQSYFLEKNFIKNSENICDILNSRVVNLRYTMTKIGSQLPANEEKSFWNQGVNLDYLKRKYTISEVEFLMLLRDLNENCGKNYTPILFFYTKDDSISRNQGYVLSWVNEKYQNNIVVFSFDKDYEDEPLINTLKLHYGISSTSTIVIDETIKKDGFVSKDEIDEILKGLIKEN